MVLRIAVHNKDKCAPKKCALECINYCPVNRMGAECIIMGEKGKPIISEELCIGCGICVHKCPFDAIVIVGLPDALSEDLVHQYGVNDFRLFRLPIPKDRMVTGLLGMNGIGKTTVVNILAGYIIPNLGVLHTEPSWDAVLDKYSGTEIAGYLKKITDEKLKVSMKPQYVDKLASLYKGKRVDDLLFSTGEEKEIERLIGELDLKPVVKSRMEELSGGELQRMAITATIAKDADVYFFDEPSSYLDIHQRMKVSEVIQKLAENKPVVVIEHDLAALDFLAGNVHLMYGEKGAYGVVAYPRGVRTAINTYLSGYLREENIRFRDKEIRFEAHPPRKTWDTAPLLHFGELVKDFGNFKVETGGGIIHIGESIGVVGANATGKTTFVKMLAGVLEPTNGWISESVAVSYKPQYISVDMHGTVEDLLAIAEVEKCPYFDSELRRPLEIDPIIRKDVERLSGGELQRVAIALALVKN
ncbi:MAG: ribosome biogenesis/translation initiation ATPase RLI, partial [Thermoplasmata archaeon]|nr:ribosome biogenesis/translation initiation ATPase RLI [Thermoplasmata archaeon]